MTKFYCVLTVFALLFTNKCLVAQTLKINSDRLVIKCYTAEMVENFRKAHPNAESEVHFENWLQKKIIEKKALRVTGAEPIIIPIIFHIISKGEAVGNAANPSGATVNQQLLQLNKDYANQSNSIYPVAANSGIQFVLAQKDNNGATLAEPGIDRINSTSKGWSDYTTSGWTPTYIDATVKPGSIFNPDNFYNIWVIPNITIGSATSILLGYATFPTASGLTGISSSETATTAGVVIKTATLGSIFTPFSCGQGFGLGKTLTHETGHFLGLRHIWGDATCGTDYCDDTPVHTTSNSGVPIHPKSNSCGTYDEMFENYMDYSDDIVLNTFTSNQVSRMQTVMGNSPRRISLAISTAGAISATGSNNIAFENCTGILNITEAGSNTVQYPRFRDLHLTLNVENIATAAATVTIVPTGSAIINTQYQLITPTVVFAAGDNYKDVVVRLFDNAEVDGNRNIILNYTISGTGVTAGSQAQQLTINVIDDDNVKVGLNSAAIYSENFETSGGILPADWYTGDFLNSPGLNSFVIGTNGGAGISGESLYITNDKTNKSLHYDLSSASDVVAITPSISTIGYRKPTLSFNYKCNGEAGASANAPTDYGELMYTFDLSTFYYLSDASGNTYTYQGVSSATNSGTISLPAALQNTNFRLGLRWINNNTLGSNPPFLIDDIVVSGTPQAPDTTVTSSYSFDINANSNSNIFRDTVNSNVLTTITNANAKLLGIKAKITQAGSGTAAVSTSGGAFTRTQKVYQVSPATANTTATYKATFYYTETEMAVWGADKLKLKFLKVKDGVDLAGTLNQSNSEIITPSVTENAAAGIITYTGSFTGFSQFMLVAPATVLPVSLVDFLVSGQTTSLLISWKTSLEINNKGFMLERSVDGINFKDLQFIAGKGNSTISSSYTYSDNFIQPGIVYYYRLKQIDMDEKTFYSPIKNGSIASLKEIQITVSPNPATDHLNIFIRGTNNVAGIQLINAIGQIMRSVNNVNVSDGFYNFMLPSVPKGVYNLLILLPEGRFNKKIVIE